MLKRVALFIATNLAIVLVLSGVLRLLGVDSMLEDKFFNDILYIKEKLKTDLKTAFNDIIVGGRVKRVQFEDFLVQ